MNKEKKEILIIILVIVAIGVFYITTIRAGHNWGDDFAMYIQHAKNMAEGRPYGETGYLFHNAHGRSVGPVAYPPVFPLLLLPIVKQFGMNIYVMKIEVIMFYLCFLVTFALFMRSRISFKYIIVILLLFSINPYIWNMKDEIMSDLLFLFFLFLFFIFLEQTLAEKESGRRRFLYAIITGILIYISYATRTIGAIFIPSIIIYDLIKHRKPTVLSIVPTAISVSLIFIQSWIIPSPNYVSMTFSNIGLESLLNNIIQYSNALTGFWFKTNSAPGKLIIFILFIVPALAGYIKKIKEEPTVLELFFVIYLSFVIGYPYFGTKRLILPLEPLFIYYLFIGISSFGLLKKRKSTGVVTVAFIVLICVYYGMGAWAHSGYTKKEIKKTSSTRKITNTITMRGEGPYKKESLELFDYIRKNTDDEDLIMFFKPRALYLYTGRRSSTYYTSMERWKLYEYRDYMHLVGATVLIECHFPEDNSGYSPDDFIAILEEKYTDGIRKVYFNPDFTVYRINRREM